MACIRGARASSPRSRRFWNLQRRGWDCSSQEPFYPALKVCRLIVNTYNHGRGDSFDGLTSLRPDLFHHPLTDVGMAYILGALLALWAPNLYIPASGALSTCTCRTSQTVEIIAPPLMHCNALFPIASTIVDRPDAVRVCMCKRPLNSISTPFAAFVEQG